MGIRCDQHFGLTKVALDMIYEEGYKEIKTFRGNGEQVGYGRISAQVARGMRMQYSSYRGMFEDDYPLFKHTLPDGTIFYEDIQAEPWSSGPCFFLALKDENGDWIEESLWPDEEIQAV